MRLSRTLEEKGRDDLTLWAYSSLLALVFVLGLPYWGIRMLVSGRYRAGLAGRLGRVPASLAEAVRGRRVVWLHAVSVGEVLAATRLVEELRAALPGVVVAVSTTTETGQALARERFPGSPIFYLPLDFAVLMRRYLRALRPELVVLMESELWPHMIHECHRAGVPLAVVNARVSDRSFPRYMRLRRVWGPLLREVTLFLAQSKETADRLQAMGIEAGRVKVPGNLKYDVRAGEPTATTRRVESWVRALGVKLVVAGSTLPGEEELLLEQWLRVQQAASPVTAMLLLAPRHTPRFRDVAALIERTGYVLVRCSALPEFSEGAMLSGNVVLLLDTIGDLASMYELAAVALVGGSLVARGGHNPLEPARFGVPVVMGPSYENFREMVEAMRAADAVQIVTPEDLAAALTGLLTNAVEASALGRRGQVFFEAQAGATGRVVGELRELLQ